MDSEVIQFRIFLIVSAMLLITAIACALVGCAISFQNISTHGSAEDLIDENQKADPEVSAPLNLPGGVPWGHS